MANFGEYGVLITDPRAFINLVASAANKVDSIGRVNCAYVEYISEDQMKNVMEMNPFRKPAADFSYQNEFRICTDTDNTELLELSLERDLRKLAIPIRLQDFAKTTHYRDGKLFVKFDLENSDN